MSPVEDRLTLFLLPASIVALGGIASLLPHDLLMQTVGVLAAWLTLSLPIGVVIGHCALQDAD